MSATVAGRATVAARASAALAVALAASLLAASLLAASLLAACSGSSGEADGGLNDAGPPIDAGAPVALVIAAPPAPAIGVPFPVTIATADGSPASVEVTLDAGGELHDVTLYRGRGSVALIAARAGALRLAARDRDGPEAVLDVAPAERAPRELSGELSGGDLLWDAAADVRLVGATTVPAGATLSIAAGARVLVDDRVSLTVLGTVVASGAPADPIVLTRATAEPWGGLRVLAGGVAELAGTWFLAGGGDPAFAFGHSESQPVVFVEASALSMTGGGVIDAPGKAFGSDGATVSLDGVLVSRCDTGGQLNDSQVTIAGAHFVEIPDADGALDDDDNDGIYVSGVRVVDGVEQLSVIRDSVFARGEDDAIDHNDALLRVERVWVERFVHEGVAASEGHAITVADSVILDCDQGVEAGYGDPAVTVEHTLITRCGNGLRYGDSYDWEVAGTLTVTGSISVGNARNVWNFVELAGGPVEGAIAIECSMVDDPAWDGLDDNLAGTPAWDGEGCLQSGSPGAAAACDGLDLGPRCDG